MTTYSIELDLVSPSTLDTQEMLIREVNRGLLTRPRSLRPGCSTTHEARKFSNASQSFQNIIQPAPSATYSSTVATK